MENIVQGTHVIFITDHAILPDGGAHPRRRGSNVLKDFCSPDWEGHSCTSCASGSDERCVPSYADGAASWWTLELQGVRNGISCHLARPQWTPCVPIQGSRGSSPDGLRAVAIQKCTLPGSRCNPTGCCLKQRSRPSPHPERQGLNGKRSEKMVRRRKTVRTRCRLVENTHHWREGYGRPLCTADFLLQPLRRSRESGRDGLSRIRRSEGPYQHAVRWVKCKLSKHSYICSEIILILKYC